MSTVTRLANHIERTFSGPMWHGPALVDVLRDVSADTAAARPIAAAHSIWELVLHTTAWADIARKRLVGEALESPSPENDFPPVADTSVGAWAKAIADLETSYQSLARTVARLPETALAERVPTEGPPHTVEVLLRGVIEHGTYHGGQIAILKRAL